ncbi:MAG: hypothetical protein MUE38_07575, partial [Flavihumibacter sp.]|nr:hypothetical protein [Flavihumibacter sp.]
MTKRIKTPPLSLEPEMIERPTSIVGFLNSQFPVNERNTLIKKTCQRLIIRFKVRFNSKKNPYTDPHYIYIRIRVNGVGARSDIATGIYIIGRQDWDKKRQRIRGYSKEVEIKNNTLT